MENSKIDEVKQRLFEMIDDADVPITCDQIIESVRNQIKKIEYRDFQVYLEEILDRINIIFGNNSNEKTGLIPEDRQRTYRLVETIFRSQELIDSFFYPEKSQIDKEKIIHVPLNEIPIQKYLDRLYLSEGIFCYIGGVARLIGKINAYEKREIINESMLRAEFPISDHDVLIGPSQDPFFVMDKIGNYISDTKRITEFQPEVLMASMDININECILAKEGLYITEEAKKAMSTGLLRWSCQYNNPIYGENFRVISNKKVLTEKALTRMVRLLATGKANSFEVPSFQPLTLGIFWHRLIAEMMSRQDSRASLMRLYSCAKQMTETQADNVKNFIHEKMVHEDEMQLKAYPHLIKESRDLDYFVKWFMKRAVDVLANSIKGTVEGNEVDYYFPIGDYYSGDIIKIEV